MFLVNTFYVQTCMIFFSFLEKKKIQTSKLDLPGMPLFVYCLVSITNTRSGTCKLTWSSFFVICFFSYLDRKTTTSTLDVCNTRGARSFICVSERSHPRRLSVTQVTLELDNLVFLAWRLSICPVFRQQLNARNKNHTCPMYSLK